MGVNLVDLDNESFADAIRQDMTRSYQERIPSATQAGIRATLEALESYQPAWNEFVSALVNRIGLVIGMSKTFENPLAQFKSGMMAYGDTVEEFYVGLLKAKTYSPQRDYLEKDIFGQNRAPVKSIYHRINRQNYYEITINEDIVRRAFLASGGLSNLVSSMMAAPTSSDNLDEFLAMAKLFSEYERDGGFYHVHIPDVAADSSSADDGRKALRKMRALAGNLVYPSSKYNAAKVPSFSTLDDLVMFTTPEYAAAIDVETLAAAFNVDRAAFGARMITIPQDQLAISGAQAILTDKNFFRVWDTLYTARSVQNPVGLYNNYFLHHHQILSVSTFVPAILFTTGADTETESIDVFIPTGLTMSLANSDGDPVAVGTALEPGKVYQLTGTVTTNPASDTAHVGVVYTVTGNKSKKTFVDAEGVLHVGFNETAAKITITGVTVHSNPDDLREGEKTANITDQSVESATVSWPIAGVIASITVKGMKVANVTPDTLNYTLAGATGATASDVQVGTYGAADVAVSVSGGVVTVVVKGGADGTVKTYKVTLS